MSYELSKNHPNSTFPGNTFEYFRNTPYEFSARSFALNQFDPIHWHDFVQIWYVVSGQFEFYINGCNFRCGSGSLIIVPPYCDHKLDTRDCGNFKTIFCDFTEHFLDDITNEYHRNALFHFIYPNALVNVKQSSPYIQLHDNDQLCANEIFENLYAEHSKGLNASKLIIHSNIIKLLSLYPLQFDQNTIEELNVFYSHYHQYIRYATNYIREHFTEDIRFFDVCKVSCMSESTFYSKFKMITGMNFTEYVQFFRVKHARLLLLYTDRTILDIADACGFKSRAYFYYIFKKFSKITPRQCRCEGKEWRRQHSEHNNPLKAKTII